MREGGYRGLAECRHQFINEIWNCSLDNKRVHKQLPIFVKTTLPFGKYQRISIFLKAELAMSLKGQHDRYDLTTDIFIAKRLL